MPSLNFQKQFVPLIESGEKRQTIRLERKVPIKAGDKLYLFTGLRTKNCKRILPHNVIVEEDYRPFVRCKGVERIVFFSRYINDTDFLICCELNGQPVIKPNELQALAKADGFDTYYDMYDFFNNQYGLPFEGVLIKW